MKARIQTIDFFRGLFLVIMMIDHNLLFGFQSIGFLLKYTFEPLGFVSAAEGFVFISGLMYGFVYGKTWILNPENFSKKNRQRIIELYRKHVILFSFICLLFLIPNFNSIWNLEWQGKLSLWKSNPAEAWGLGVLFLYQTSFVDVLPLYIFLISYSGIILPLLAKGYTKTTVSLSFVGWIMGHFFLQEKIGTHFGLVLGWFEFLSWQFLFVSAMTIGLRWYQGKIIPLRTSFFYFSLALVLLFLASRHGLSHGNELAVNVRNLGIIRLINFAALGYLFYYLASLYKNLFNFEPLAILGRSSLDVFTFHVFVVYLLGAADQFVKEIPLFWQILALLFALSSLYLPVLWKRVRSQKTV